MPNQIDVRETAFFELESLLEVEPYRAELAAAKIDECLQWYNPFDDANYTANGARILPSPLRLPGVSYAFHLLTA